MKKIITENGVTPYKPWSVERRLRARLNSLNRLHGNFNDPKESIDRRYESSRRAERVVQESKMNQQVKANWSDAQKQEARERSKAHWQKRRLAVSREERAELKARLTKEASLKAAHKAEMAERARLKSRLNELKAQQRAEAKTAPAGRLLKLEGAIQELMRALGQMDTDRPAMNVSSENT